MATTSWTILTPGAVANQGLNPIPAGGNIGDVLTKTSLTDYVFDWVAPSGGGGGGAVSSVFGRTGAVVAAADDYTFAQIGAKPTTRAGYGITDAAALVHTHAASDITSGTIAPARLGSGSGGATKFLREDNTWQAISGGGDALVANPLSQFAATTSAQLAGVISDETGTGALVFATNPSITINASCLTAGTIPDARFPATLPAASGANLTALNATNISSGTLAAARLPATAALTTGNLSQFAATTSAQLAGVISDETGTGALVFATNPTITINASCLTAGTIPDARFPATLPAASGANLTALNASNLASGTVAPARLGTGSGGSTKFLREDNTWQTIGGGGDALTSGNLSQFAATTSAQLAGVISDETGTGALVFGTNPTLVGLTLSGAVTGGDQELRAVAQRDSVYYASSPAISGGVLNLDYAAGPIFKVSLNAAITSITFSNLPASGHMASITIRFTADGTVRAITWPPSVRWGSAGAPSAMTGTSGKVDYVQLVSVDGGTTWDAFLNGQNF